MVNTIVTRKSPHLWFSSVALAACLLPLQSALPRTLAQDDSKLVAIQRRKLTITPADAYRLPLRLEPIRSVTVTAPCDGTVKSISEKEGRAVNAQMELIRLDNPRLDLVAKRANAAKELAQQELRIARASTNPDQIKLGEAKVALAEAEWSLAVFDQSSTSIRVPYAATILRIHVAEGQQVTEGEPLVSFGETSQLKCRLPVDREHVLAGSSMDLLIESQTLKVTVDSIAPLASDHDKLRELAVSAATAVVKLDNANQKWHPGQVVYGPLSPKGPVANVPLTAVKADASGNRIVQVVRDGVIRSVAVTLHGQVGMESVFVSGQFGTQDELVTSATRELADGTALKPAAPGQVAVSTSKSAENAAVGTSPTASGVPPKKTSAAGF
mgnify:CR=1 FL=1